MNKSENKKELEEEKKQIKEEKERFNKILKISLERAKFSILEKIDLCFEIYKYITIKKKKENEKYIYYFEVPIKNGWKRRQAESLEEGIEELLKK